MPNAVANTASMEKQAPPRWPGRRMQSQIERKGMRPRFAAYLIIAFWALAVVAFGVVERLVDPDSFDNVWLGMWWAIQTVTTVGYGDVVPETTAGKVVAYLFDVGRLVVVGGGDRRDHQRLRGTGAGSARGRQNPGDPVMEKLEEMAARLEAIDTDLARLQRGSDAGG